MPHRRIDRHLGTRGWLLLWCAAVWACLGVGITTGAASSGDPALIHLLAPGWLRAAGWWVSAALAVYGAVRTRHAYLGVGALMAMPAIYLGSYLWAWITYLVPGYPPGMEHGWYAAVLFAALVTLVVITARVKEPTKDGKV